MLNFGEISSQQPTWANPETETPFRIALIGDFSGRGNRGEQSSPGQLSGRGPIAINFDRLDEVLAELAPKLQVPIDGGAVTAELSFDELDSFHPDAIIRQVDEIDDRRDDREVATLLMRQLLHHPDYKALEAAWRGAEWLLRRTDKIKTIEVVLFDLTATEFAADLTSGDDLSATQIYGWLVKQPADKSIPLPWAALTVLYPEFGLSTETAQLFGRAARIAAVAGAPLLAGVSAEILTAEFELSGELKTDWQELRDLPAATYLGLATPGFLLRPPFGANYRSVEAFDFEESSGANDEYLWGSPALALAALLAQNFTAQGWDFRPRTSRLQLDGMPIHAARDADGDEVGITTEVRFASSVAQTVVDVGVMPVLAIRGRDAIELGRIRPLLADGEDLAGPWQQAAGVAAPLSAPRYGMAVNTTGGAVTSPGKQRSEGAYQTAEKRSTQPAAASDENPADENDSGQASDGAATTDDDNPFSSPTADAPTDPTAADDEFAALMASLDAPAAPSADDSADSTADDELAALMASMDEPVPTEESPTPPAGESSADDDLAALMASMDEPVPAEEAPTPHAGESSADDDLAALMASMETSDVRSSQSAVEAPASSTDDDDLAALMASMDEPATTEEAPTPPAGESSADDDLAALMASMETSDVSSSRSADEASAPSTDDDDLAALMASLDSGDPGDTSQTLVAAPDAVSSQSRSEISPDEPEPESETTPEPVVRPVEQFRSPPIQTTAPADDVEFTNDGNERISMATDAIDIDQAIADADQATKYGQPGSGSPALIDFRSLLQPISADEPAGGSVPFGARENLELWRKDINPDDFPADDPTRPADQVSADWSAIVDLTQEVLRNDSKNLQIAARLLEGLSQKFGFAGLRDGLHLMRLMLDVCWDRIDPPLEDDDLEVRAGPFNWLDDPDRGACFPHTVRNMPVLKYGDLSFGTGTFGAADKGTIDRTVADVSREACQIMVENLTQCQLEVQALIQSLAAKLGREAPGFTALRPAINEAAALAKQILARKPASDSANESGESAGDANGAAGEGGERVVYRQARMNTREDIYKQLREAAEALTKLEPHSPVPFLIYRAVDFGSMPFPQLMAALIRDVNVLSEMNRELGIKPPDDQM